MKRIVNPFRNAIVRDPWRESGPDVSEINDDAFRRCKEALHLVRSGQGSTSVLLHGEAGSGKTHLLSRVRSWLSEEEELAIFIWVRLNCGPNRFWRHVRSSFVDNLTRVRSGRRTQLHELLIERIAARFGSKFANRDPRPRRKEVQPYIQQISLHAELTRDMARAIDHLVFSRHVLDSIAWLRGESLPESVLEKLGLSTVQDDDEDAEAVARDVVRSLCRLAGEDIPIVFCFDQIEALQRHEQDKDGIFVFGKAIRSLYDMTDNVLIVSCIQSYYLPKLKEAMQQPNYDALAVQTGTLNPIVPRLAKKLARSRLGLLELEDDGFAELQKLIDERIDEVVPPQGLAARLVLGNCASVFEAWEKGEERQAPKACERTVEEFLEEEITKRQEESLAEMTPERTDEVVQASVPILMNLLDNEWREVDDGKPRDIDVLLQKEARRVGLSLCNHLNLTSLAKRLRRLRGEVKEDNIDKLVVLRHAQRPISKRAVKTREHLTHLQGGKSVFLRPDSEILSALDAMRSLLSDAKSGDLSDGNSTFSAASVSQWIKENLSGNARDFVEDIVAPIKDTQAASSTIDPKTVATDATFDDSLPELLLLLEDKRMLPLEEAAKLLEVEVSQLEKTARNHPGKIGYLAGPPSVVYQYVPDSVSSS